MEKRFWLTDEQFEDLQYSLVSGMTVSEWVNLMFPETVAAEWYMDKGGVIVIK